MDYLEMSREQLINENLALYSKKNHIQGRMAAPATSPIFRKMTFVACPELFCRFSKDFIYTFINEAYINFLKTRKMDHLVIGTSILELLDKQYHNDAIASLQSLTPDNPVLAAEYTWMDNDNKIRWRCWHVRGIFDDNGLLVEYHATGRDITDQKETEQQIKHRLNIEHALATASKLLIGAGEADMDAVINIIGAAISVNRVYIIQFHDNQEKMSNTYEWCSGTSPLIEYVQNVDTEVYSWGKQILLRGENIVINDINNLPPEAAGERKALELQKVYAALLVPIYSLSKSLLGYIGFNDTEKNRIWNNDDIACLEVLAEMLGAYWDRKNMEKALRASEAKFRTLADMAPALIYVWSHSAGETSLKYLNNPHSSISGYNLADIQNKNLWSLIHPDFRNLAKIRGLSRLNGGTAPNGYELKFITGSGEERWGRISAQAIEWENQPAVMGLIYDVTNNKKMEEELWQARYELEKRVIERTTELVLVNRELQREIAERQQTQAQLILSEKRYRAIIDDQNELVLRTLPDGTITFVNDAFCRYFGKTSESLVGINALQALPEENRTTVINKINSLNYSHPESSHTLPVRRFDGITCWQEWTGRAILKGQDIVEFQAVGRDISERKNSEEALKRSEANFRKLADTAPAIIFVYSEDRLLYANSAMENLTNLPKKQLYKMNPMEIFHSDCKQLVKSNSIARLNGEKIPPYEVSMVGENGDQWWGYLYADTIEYEGKNSILGVIVEITERKKMEESLLQTSKLESLGILAGGIAHDFNNILTVISGNVSLAKMYLEEDNELTEVLDEVEKAAFQARDLTQQLLTFSKGGAPIKETASIQELLRESASFVLRGSNVSCHYAIADDLWPVSIDKGQISQVINNLIINAYQAMPGGGSIQLSAINVGSDMDLPFSPQADKYVKISIKDQGIGISEKHLSKIFDPYFTTKQKGHGLGLATCYSIIKKHDGEINIESRSGSGTNVIIYLPAYPDMVVEERVIPKLYFPGQGRVLIMDDEAVVRETLGKMLQRLGYTAGFAADGLNAIHLYQAAQQANEPYDVVLMDLTIAGGMGGKEAVKKLLELDSKAKVIVSSGYSNDPVMAEYKKYGFSGVLPKPFEIQAVNKLLYELISRNEAV